ncbi:thermonuclease family protein [Levilinea saccharolytica]|uniref:thermonuclease family protein n=1 Tax=Levilinea saccharolytica TaxID=229921 RepID=UPI0007811B67|nr:thermonuclease family protein [Levilinea saccharolytica]GAP18547.1 micrococcal nuclease (thermonuclease) homolog [Levilinea saccharolytica]
MTAPLTTQSLRRAQAHLDQTRQEAQEAIQKIFARRAALYREGIAASSQRIRLALARQVNGLDEESGGWKVTLQLVEHQIQLLGRLIWAMEVGERPDRPPLAGVDWLEALAVVPTQAAVGWISRIRQYLDLLIGPSLATETAGPREEIALAVRVPDGDGLVLADGRRVRYIGIDAPEMTTWEGPPEPFARQAKAANQQWVVGQRVRLVRDVSEVDRYGRLLRFVYVGETLVNAELLKAGLARALSIQPDTGRALEFQALEWEARRKGKGLWGA